MSRPAGGERPAVVVLIGWVWIVLSGLALAGSLITLTVFRGLQDVSINIRQQGAADLPAPLAGAAWLAEHFTLIVTLQITTVSVILIIAISFLRLHPWARPALLAVQYLSIGVLLAKAAWWWSHIQMVAGGLGLSGVFESLARGLAVVVVLLYGVPIGLMIGCLHGRRVRRAFASNGPPGGPSTP
ncbi:MAG: hypothetical protein O7F16_10115 [Acidobacteria bacterium]|nr:hypothetical protein [Acidobacteriota bacterium]